MNQGSSNISDKDESAASEDKMLLYPIAQLRKTGVEAGGVNYSVGHASPEQSEALIKAFEERHPTVERLMDPGTRLPLILPPQSVELWSEKGLKAMTPLTGNLVFKLSAPEETIIRVGLGQVLFDETQCSLAEACLETAAAVFDMIRDALRSVSSDFRQIPAFELRFLILGNDESTEALRAAVSECTGDFMVDEHLEEGRVGQVLMSQTVTAH
jgi:hypothetical protein